MRRMISQKLQDLLKKLSQSIWADDKGNLEVGKNLEVDGKLNVNGDIDVQNDVACTDLHATDVYTTDSEGNNVRVEPALYSKAKYHHCVTIQFAYAASGATSADYKICFSADSSKNTPIDSYQDLNAVFGGRRIAVTGCANSDGSPVYIDLHGGTIATDYLQCWDMAANESEFKFPLSSLTLVTYKDDVSMN